MEIAKFRAARLLWAQIVKQYVDDSTQRRGDTENGSAEEKLCVSASLRTTYECAKMCINATTSTYNQTLFDSYVNLLRSQTEAMSAALGSVHSMVVTPFDAPYKETGVRSQESGDRSQETGDRSQETGDRSQVSGDFSERIARNQQLIIKEESHFDRIVDPGAGSYYIEHLTDALATEAWKIFLKVEEEGGFLAAVKAGTIQDDINATNVKRHGDAAKRKEFLLGTNQFPNFTEKSEGKKSVQNDCCTQRHRDTENGSAEEKLCDSASLCTFKKIESTRLAADFEDLRIHTEETRVPTAFMLTIGNLAMRQARAQFSCNFLACAGYKVIDNLGFKTVEEGVDAALEAKADIVVICSSDDEYAEYAIPAFKYLNGRAMFVVAGAPACMEDLKAAGIENYIHVKCNVLETLKEYNQKLGI
jgi:methylmalonyl-CoA mutase